MAMVEGDSETQRDSLTLASSSGRELGQLRERTSKRFRAKSHPPKRQTRLPARKRILVEENRKATRARKHTSTSRTPQER